MSRFTQKIKKEPNGSVCVAILSAGVGKRIKSYEPRSLIKIGNRTLIEHQISVLQNSFDNPDIILVTGYSTNRIIRKTKNKVRIVENQLFDQTTSSESLRLAINNTTSSSMLFLHGDLYFNLNTLSELKYDRSFLIIDNKDQINSKEVGITVVNKRATILSYGLSTKWCQMAYITGKEFEAIKNLYLRGNETIKKMLLFEIINLIISKGGSFICYEPDNMSILEIDCMRDLANENFNIK